VEDALLVVALSALTSVQTRGSTPPRTAGKNRHTKPTVAASSDLTRRDKQVSTQLAHNDTHTTLVDQEEVQSRRR
jgi:hypothetical protein